MIPDPKRVIIGGPSVSMETIDDFLEIVKDVVDSHRKWGEAIRRDGVGTDATNGAFAQFLACWYKANRFVQDYAWSAQAQYETSVDFAEKNPVVAALVHELVVGIVQSTPSDLKTYSDDWRSKCVLALDSLAQKLAGI